MNMFLIIGLIVLLVGVLVYNRRKRASAATDDIGLSAAPMAAPAPEPAPQAPLPRPAVLANETVPARVHTPPPPSNWIPEETIVEPGWPLPGEISGNWSPVTTDAGASAAVREVAATAVAEPPAPDTAPAESADEWLMPESPAMTWPAPVEEPIPSLAPEPVLVSEPVSTDEPAPQEPPVVWDPPVAEMDTPVWTPPAAPEPFVAAPEPVAPQPEPWQEIAPAAPAPVVWDLDAPPPPAPAVAVAVEPEPEAEPVVVPDPPVVLEPAPAVAEWIDPPPAIVPDAPVAVAAPEFPEFPGVAEIAPAPEPEAEPEPDDIRDQSRAVADLAPLLEGLVPLTRVSDRHGVTPRMLVLMRVLAERPLSVSEQARLLDVSRPLVADLCARLESQGLAVRERDETDRRRVRIALSERGRRACEETSGTDPAVVETALARMSPDERADLIRGVRALERVATAT